MGPQSSRETLLECARLAEEAGLDDLWVADHIAIPPDRSEGSEGRYLDPLATLAFLAGTTSRIGLGTGVLVLPYRPPLPTAKWVATIQELSDNRLRLGVGVGWMGAEFRALGVPKRRRDRIADDTLEFLQRCFAADVVDSNGQSFLFRPRPARPPIYVGGASPRALERAARFGDGWMPMGTDPALLAAGLAGLRRRASELGRPVPEAIVLGGFPLEDPPRAADTARSLVEAGATGLVHAGRYCDAREFGRWVEVLERDVRPVLRKR
jgi:probable F420-dependent oxidoreductase